MNAAGDPSFFDVAVVGFGVVPSQHMTLETEAVLRRCQQAFTLDNGYRADTVLRELELEVIDLNGMYEEGAERRESYRRMAAAVISSATSKPPVAFVTYGHPKMLCYPSMLIQRAAPLLGLRLLTLPAVSALDTLLVDLNYDFGTGGLQMYDATDALLRHRPLQTDVPCVLWQATWVDQPKFRSDRPAAQDLRELQIYLLEFYPPDHDVFSVYSSPHPALQSIVERYQMGQLAEGLASGAVSGTLFIPPVEHRPIVGH